MSLQPCRLQWPALNTRFKAAEITKIRRSLFFIKPGEVSRVGYEGGKPVPHQGTGIAAIGLKAIQGKSQTTHGGFRVYPTIPGCSAYQRPDVQLPYSPYRYLHSAQMLDR